MSLARWLAHAPRIPGRQSRASHGAVGSRKPTHDPLFGGQRFPPAISKTLQALIDAAPTARVRLACLGNNGTARLKRRPRRLLARLSNSCDVLNLRQAGLGASHQGLIAATCRQSFRQQGSFGISRYTAAPLVWNLRDPTGVLDEAPLENGRRLCCVTRDGGVTPRTERCVLDRKPDA